jgi:glycosyltransferase involved in cell wall biosynthesis
MTIRRKLLFYTHGLVGGGAERVFARLASGFAARGDEVIFVVDFEAQENLALLSRDVNLIVLPRGHARASLELARLLRRERPDASLSAIGVSNLKHVAASLLAGRVARAIISYHGYYESEPERLSNLGYRLTPVFSRLVGATIAVSNALRDDLVTRFSVPKARIVTVYNPAAPEPFPHSISAGDLASRTMMVLSMGRLVPDKDFVTLLRAFALSRHRDARLVILGEGPERDRLQAEAQRLGIEPRVSMPGFSAEVGPELDRARGFVVSSCREAFGLACVEALAHGLPVVATDCGGPIEVLGPMGTAAPIAVGDETALAAAIDAMLDDPGDPAPRQQRAIAFSLEAALDGYDAVIQRVSHR